MEPDQALSIFSNVMGMSIFVLIVFYHYVTANQRVKKKIFLKTFKGSFLRKNLKKIKKNNSFYLNNCQNSQKNNNSDANSQRYTSNNSQNHTNQNS
jgi:type II secretory pathway component PulC